MKSIFNFTPYPKVNSKRTIDLIVKPQTIKHFEGKQKYLYNLELNKDFLEDKEQ